MSVWVYIHVCCAHIHVYVCTYLLKLYLNKYHIIYIYILNTIIYYIYAYKYFVYYGFIRYIIEKNSTHTYMHTWRFPNMGIPLNHPFIDHILHEINHPAIDAIWGNLRMLTLTCIYLIQILSHQGTKAKPCELIPRVTWPGSTSAVDPKGTGTHPVNTTRLATNGGSSWLILLENHWMIT